MNCLSSLLLLSALVGTAIGCLPGLGLPGAGGGGGCCSAAQPSCASPCGAAAAPPAVYAAAPLAPAPFAAYPQAPPPPALPVQFPQQPLGIFSQQLPVQSGYVASAQGNNFQTGAIQTGAVQTGPVSAGGAYLNEPVAQVQPLPLLGQPVAYEKTVVVAPTQQELNTAQILTKVMPASAVLDEHFAEPAAASPNNIVTSINSQTSYGDEQQTHNAFQAPVAASSSSSSSSSSSASSEHHATHQVRVPSASSSVEASERVVPDVVVKQIIDTFDTTPYPQQVALETAAPYVPQPARPQQLNYLSPEAPVVPQTVQIIPEPIQTVQPVQPAPYQPAPIETAPIQPAPVQPAPYQPAPVQPAPYQPAPIETASVQPVPIETAPIQPAPAVQQVPYQPAPVQPVPIETAPIQPAPIQPEPLQPAETIPVAVETITQAPAHFVPETKIVAVEDRIEAVGGSDYDQPTNIASNEQATVNELLATLDNATPTVTSNLDFNQVTIEPQPNQAAVIQTEGDDYDAPLNEDRKDVPTAEPSHVIAPSVPQPVAVVPEETAPIIPQPIQPIQPVQTYQPSTAAPIVETTVGYVEPPKPQVHLQPIVPAVRVELTTAEPIPTPVFEEPVEVHEIVTPQVPLQPEPAIIQTITEEPIAEVTVEVLGTTAAPAASQFFENITSREETHEVPAPSQPEPAPSAAETPAPLTNGADYEEEKSVENKVSTETDVVPNLGEYGSKFAKVQGAETKQVSEPIEIETIENANPYGRKYWIF